MLKRLIFGAIFAAGLGSVALAAPTPPSQCSGTYTKTIEVTGDSQSVRGTAGNDYIVVSGDNNLVKGLGGDDCIYVVGGADANYVQGNEGNDVIVDNGTRTLLRGNGGNDHLVSSGNSSLKGDAGIDTCEYDPNIASASGCEL